MTDRLCVAIAGQAGSGKTSTAGLLESRYEAKTISLAKPLKDLEAVLWSHGLVNATAFMVGQYTAFRRSSEKGYLPDVESAPIKEFKQILEELHAIPAAEGDAKRRPRLQFLGDSVRRRIDPVYWVTLLAQAARTTAAKSLVCDDCRYLNEAQYFLDNGWKVIALEADEDVRFDRLSLFNPGADRAQLNHPSEQDIPLIAQLPGVVCIDANQDLMSMLHYVVQAVEEDC